MPRTPHLGKKGFDKPKRLWHRAALIRNTAKEAPNMPNEEWGTKRVCPETQKRFYDLGRDPVVSPYTGEEYPLSVFSLDKSKTTMADKADKSAVAKATEEDLSEDVDVLDDDDTADVDLGDDVLDDEEDENVPLEEIADVAAPSDDET